MVLVLAVLGAMGLAGFAQRPHRVDLEAAKAAIMDADIQFCRATNEKGLGGDLLRSSRKTSPIFAQTRHWCRGVRGSPSAGRGCSPTPR